MSRPPVRWFARMFGIAALAHLIGNPIGDVQPLPPALPLVDGFLGLAAAGLVLRPSRPLLVGAAGLVLGSAWLEAPFLGNHWLLMALASAGILLAVARPEPWPRLMPALRWVFLVFYAFAAFAKLNDGFLTPQTSCGVFFTNHALAAAGLPTVAPHGLLAGLVVMGIVAVELSVPVLLAIPRTRRFGVGLAVLFHGAIALDLDQHFYDFTAVLFVFLGLFAGDDFAARVEERLARASEHRWLRRAMIGGVAAALGLVAIALVPSTPLTWRLLYRAPFLLWGPFSLWFAWRVLVGGSEPSPPDHGALRLRSPALIALVALTALNGLTPYLELKTAYGFTMYANLHTVRGESNHLIVRRTWPLSPVHEQLVEVVASDDPGLAPYVGTGYLVPERNLRHYLSVTPEARVTVREAAGDRGASADPDAVRELGPEDAQRMPLLVEKLLLFRAVDTHSPPRCQDLWLPAR